MTGQLIDALAAVTARNTESGRHDFLPSCADRWASFGNSFHVLLLIMQANGAYCHDLFGGGGHEKCLLISGLSKSRRTEGDLITVFRYRVACHGRAKRGIQ